MDSTVSTSWRVSCSWKMMLALGCMPNTSGASVAGSCWMYSLHRHRQAQCAMSVLHHHMAPAWGRREQKDAQGTLICAVLDMIN